jgi:D-alanyl-lipoteichoic acid acyltransferase DltB (MBOAT superfamily)
VLLCASYCFYATFKPAFVLLLIATTLVAYVAGLLLEKYESDDRARRRLLIGAIGTHLCVLFSFKYLSFACATLDEILLGLGLGLKGPALDILLPVGISFYTLQVVGYLIDVYRRDFRAERHIGYFAVFVAFFPQLLSGPIGRSALLLPQLRQKYVVSYEDCRDGVVQIALGLFKKLVVADRLAIWSSAVFSNPGHHSGLTLAVANLFFAFQIYADFSGYSDIAIGSARLMGIRLSANFNQPYFATSVSELWQKWHMSLSSWIRDYLYLPLSIALRNLASWGVAASLLCTFVIVGLWHGANWTYVVFGLLQGTALAVEALTSRTRKKAFRSVPKWVAATMGVTITFAFWYFTIVFFRASTNQEALMILRRIVSVQGPLATMDIFQFSNCLLALALFSLLEIKQFVFGEKAAFLRSRRMAIRYLSFAALLLSIVGLGVFDGGQFIYFKF